MTTDADCACILQRSTDWQILLPIAHHRRMTVPTTLAEVIEAQKNSIGVLNQACVNFHGSRPYLQGPL